jgi:hypothetical protein
MLASINAASIPTLNVALNVDKLNLTTTSPSVQVFPSPNSPYADAQTLLGWSSSVVKDAPTEVLDSLANMINAGNDPIIASRYEWKGSQLLVVRQDSSLTNVFVEANIQGSIASEVSIGRHVYTSLYSSAPTDADSGTEIAAVGYERQRVPFSSVVGGAAYNTQDIIFGPASTGGWGTITHVAIHDAPEGSNLLYHGLLEVPKTILEDDEFRYRINYLGVSLT